MSGLVAEDAHLAEFARRYFRMIGAGLTVDLPDYVEVDLPDAWRRWFDGRPRLAVAFTREALADHGDAQRLTHGARLLEQISASLAERGDFLSGEIAGGAELGWPRIDGALATAEGAVARAGTALAVWYRVTLVADEARESLVPIAVSADLPDALTARLGRVLEAGVPAAWRDAAAAPDAAPPLFALARARLAEAIGGAVDRFRAEKEAAREEALARLRLHHEAERSELARLSSEGARQQLARLPETMLRRVEEERDTYTVRVKATPLAAALARVTVVEQRVRWERPDGAAVELTLAGCPGLEAVAQVPCAACGEGVVEGAVCGPADLRRTPVDGEAHLVHAQCQGACGGCGRAACRTCLTARCLIADGCAERLCARCAVGCTTCRRPGCARHAPACGVCGSPGCADHTVACAFCRGPTCVACRAGAVPVTGVAGDLECAACRAIRAGVGEAGARRVVTVRGWLGGRIELWSAGALVSRRWVPPWRCWFDRRFRPR